MPKIDIAGQANSTSAVSSLNITTSESILSNETCVLCITGAANASGISVSSITDAGSTWVKADGVTAPGGNNAEVWYCINHASLNSSSTITINLNRTCEPSTTLYRFVGASVPLLDHGSASAASGSPSVSTSGSVNSNVIVFGCCVDGSSLTAPGGIWISDYLANSFGGTGAINFNHCHGVTTSAGSATFSPSASSSAWGAAIAAFSPLRPGGFFF